MAVFINKTEHSVQFWGYRADGLDFKQEAPVIEPGEARYINQDHYGDNDWYLVVAFMKDSRIPKAIDVKEGKSHDSNMIGVEILGFGFTLGGGFRAASYSTSMALVMAKPHDVWTLKEDKEKNLWVFHEGGDYKNSDLHGW